jgi:tetratricopeptide (TPR) repeat protein
VAPDDAAQAAHKCAGALIDERRFREAVEPAAEACRLRPDWADAWWNYGVALKHAHEWAECLRACERAIDLDPGNCDGARWNAGIAATALGQWTVARKAWADYGIEIPPGDGPLEMAIGHAGVRVAPDTEPEVVFCKRLDPCRAVVRSVPLPESDRRFGDVVLHDGESRGKRRLGDALIPVFDELQLLSRSEYGTWRVTADCQSPTERDALLALFDDADGSVEDWTESIVVLCSKCSLGEPHDEHDERPDQAWRRQRELGLALRDERELRRLRQLGLWWRRGVRDVTKVL